MDVSYLAKKNFHPRDTRIEFDEGPHIYYIDGSCKGYVSVTTWNHSHFEHFDADAIITKMMASPKWTNNKYYGKTRDEIKGQWDANRDEAASAGTKMHFDIECYYNSLQVQNTSTEYSYFEAFLANMREKKYGNLAPYRTEWTVFDEDLKLSGSIDMVFQRLDNDGNPTDTLEIYDWKRCRDISKTSGFGKFAHTECISHLPDTNYWHYCLQLNIYKAILERRYGKKVDGLYLVCLHPDNKNKSYMRIKVANLEEEVAELFEYRKEQIGK